MFRAGRRGGKMPMKRVDSRLVCARCGDDMVRMHRTRWMRIWYAAMYRCRSCDLNRGVSRLQVFRISLHCCCPRCGSETLERLSKRDRIEGFSRSPVSLVQMLLGAPLSWCPLCRLQFYDFRPRRKLRGTDEGSAA